MREKIVRVLIKTLIKLRWAYFHMHPGYVKFLIEDEAHFFHQRTNSIHSNLRYE